MDTHGSSRKFPKRNISLTRLRSVDLNCSLYYPDEWSEIEPEGYSINLSLISIQAFHVYVTSATTWTQQRGENHGCTHPGFWEVSVSWILTAPSWGQAWWLIAWCRSLWGDPDLLVVQNDMIASWPSSQELFPRLSNRWKVLLGLPLILSPGVVRTTAWGPSDVCLSFPGGWGGILIKFYFPVWKKLNYSTLPASLGCTRKVYFLNWKINSFNINFACTSFVSTKIEIWYSTTIFLHICVFIYFQVSSLISGIVIVRKIWPFWARAGWESKVWIVTQNVQR